MKYLISFLMFFLLLSCSTKEESVISNLINLTEEVKANGANYTAEDWDNVAAEYEIILQEASECRFTPEQEREFGRQSAQFLVYSAGHFKNELQREIENLSGTLKNIFIGIGEGLRDIE